MIAQYIQAGLKYMEAANSMQVLVLRCNPVLMCVISNMGGCGAVDECVRLSDGGQMQLAAEQSARKHTRGLTTRTKGLFNDTANFFETCASLCNEHKEYAFGAVWYADQLNPPANSPPYCFPFFLVCCDTIV